MRTDVRISLIAATLTSLLIGSMPLRAETAEEWIQFGTRVHGGFNALIAVGIRIGLDARQRLTAEPRGLTVTYFIGEKSPCPCIADGVMIATQASPGQGTLHMSLERAPSGVHAAALIRDRKSGGGFRYTISDDWAPKIVAWDSLDPAGRFAAAMSADGLFEVTASQFGHPARTSPGAR